MLSAQVSAPAHRKYTIRAIKEASPEWLPLYRVRNAVKTANARARGRLDIKTAYNIYLQQNGFCFYCKTVLDVADFQLDHMLPVVRGGTNDPSNVVFVCSRCNQAKGTSTADEYLDWLYDIARHFSVESSGD